MLHPLFSVVVSRPEMVAEHLAGYAALVRAESAATGAQLAHRAVAGAAALLSACAALVLGGVAVMLGVLQGHFHWVLVLVPAVALVPALIGWQLASKPLPETAFATLAGQFNADVQALRVAGDEHRGQ